MTPDFAASEFERRTERAQRAMKAANIDALFVMTEPEVRYFTGFRTLFWQSPTRPWFVVVPASGKPIAAIPEIGAALMRETWIDDIRTWSSPHADDDGVSLLIDTLKGYDRIGVPMGRESVLRMPLLDFDRVRDGLHASAFVDATDLMQRLRMVKSEAEIQTVADICAIASASFARAGDLFRVGQTVADAFRAFKIDLLQGGADDVPYLVGGCGQGGYADVISPPSDTPIRAGDILMLDTGSMLRGYSCDFDRNWAFGDASDAAKRTYNTLYRATDAAFAIARPGATAADLFKAMADVIGQDESDIGRYGHGLGMQLTEPPSNIHFDQTVLEPGMIMTLEPSMEIEAGKMMVHEENIVIRDGAPEYLSTRVAPELPIL